MAPSCALPCSFLEILAFTLIGVGEASLCGFNYCGLPGYGLYLCSHPYRNVQSGLAKEVTSTLRQVVVIGVEHREAIITWLCVLQPGM